MTPAYHIATVLTRLASNVYSESNISGQNSTKKKGYIRSFLILRHLVLVLEHTFLPGLFSGFPLFLVSDYALQRLVAELPPHKTGEVGFPRCGEVGSCIQQSMQYYGGRKAGLRRR